MISNNHYIFSNYLKSITMECIVCLENITRTTPNIECGHKIHHKCLLKRKYACNYNNEQFTCPYCTQHIDNMRKTRSEYRNNLKTIMELMTKFEAVDKNEKMNIKYNERIRIIIKIFKVVNTNKSLLYKSEKLVRVIHKQAFVLKQQLKEVNDNVKKTLFKKLNNELDEILKILNIYTLSKVV